MARFESEQKKAILEAAVKVFADKGWKGATIRLVGRKAGVNSALMYYYFENKSVLFEECIRLVLEGFLESLQAGGRRFRDGRDRVRFLVDGILDYFLKWPERGQLMSIALDYHPELFGRVLTRFASSKVLTPLIILQDGMKKGEIQSLHPVHAWWAIMGVCRFSLHMHGVLKHLNRRVMPFEVPDMSARRETIVDLLSHGLCSAEKRVRTEKIGKAISQSRKARQVKP